MPNHTAFQADTVVVARPPQLDRLLEDAPRLEPEHHWEGELAGSHGAANGCVIRIAAQIAFPGSLIAGSGRMLNKLDGSPDFVPDLDLTGTLEKGAVALQLWFAGAEIRHVPFVGTGRLSNDAREMTGDWSVQCFNPKTCGCDGGCGTFRLVRVD